MIDRFQELLNELSPLVGVPLCLDKHGACKLHMHNLHVQLEFVPRKESLLLATFIQEIPPGKFRENILKDALRANWPYPKDGTLAYSERNNQLVLFSHVPLESLKGILLFSMLTVFTIKANLWRSAIDTGNTTSLIPPLKT